VLTFSQVFVPICLISSGERECSEINSSHRSRTLAKICLHIAGIGGGIDRIL